MFRTLKRAAVGLIGLALASCAVATHAVAETTAAVLPVVTIEPSWWQSALAAATPVLLAAAVAIFGWIGTIIKAKADQYVPHMIGQVISSQYDKMTDAAAGFLAVELKKVAGGAVSSFPASLPAVDANQPAVKAAVKYAQDSFPEAIAGAGVTSPFELAQDIIAAFGKQHAAKPAA